MTSDLSETPLPATEPADAVAFSTRTGGPSRLRVGAVAGAAVALAVGVVATSFAASPALSTSTATGSSAAAPLAVALDPAVDEIDLDHGRFGGRGGFRDITIATIRGTSVTLGTDDGWTRTITVTDAIDLTKGGQDIAFGDLKVGDSVRFRQTRNDDGTYTVTALAVVVPSVRGEVSGVSSSGFKVTSRDGAVWTITVNGSTEYRFGTADGALSDITNGATVIVAGTSTGDNALTALTVRVGADRAIGTVTAKTADTITVKRRDGSSLTVHVDGDTTYRVAGVESADLGDVTADMAIGVSGRTRADGSIDADAIVAGTGGGFLHGDGAGFGGKGFGGKGFGLGRGFGPGWGDDGTVDGATPTEAPAAG